MCLLALSASNPDVLSSFLPLSLCLDISSSRSKIISRLQAGTSYFVPCPELYGQLLHIFRIILEPLNYGSGVLIRVLRSSHRLVSYKEGYDVRGKVKDTTPARDPSARARATGKGSSKTTELSIGSIKIAFKTLTSKITLHTLLFKLLKAFSTLTSDGLCFSFILTLCHLNLLSGSLKFEVNNILPKTSSS